MINREFSVPRTPQQNRITEKKNRTRIEAARTMLADSLLPIPFWVEAVNTACSGPTWLFDIDTLTKSMNYQPVIAKNQSNPSVDPQNTDGDATFEVKEPEFEVKKPESKVYVSPISSDQTKKHDDKTKREAKCKSPVELSIGYRNLSAEFEDFFDNIINEVNAADTPVPAAGQISTNSTNTFSAAGPSNIVVSPTHGKSSYMDLSQYLDDPDMLALEDITYSDDEEDVGAEADFNNLETNIAVSPIPTIRVHKDHHVTQIIGDLSLATQTRNMTRVVKDQEPKRVHQALKDPSWIEAIQEELLQFKIQKVYVDDVIFGFTNKDLCKDFEKLMKDKFQMSSKGEITFFLGLQVKQKPDGIFISQDKYVAEILRKFGLTDEKSASTPIDIEKPLLKDLDGEDVDVHTYRSMIG
nr:uncharacterized mitochondrial protein AtMg00810-like [Tanacetum cinerariifolium]